MYRKTEAVYRDHLSNGPVCLTNALDTVVPPEIGQDDPSTRLTRRLCFEPGQYNDTPGPALAEALPQMLDHGLRQVALADVVLADEAINESMPAWFDATLFGQALLTADAGLVFVPREEVHTVHEFGPKYAVHYPMHPTYGHGIAEAWRQPGDHKSKMLSLLIARHHAIQARNAYGPEWHELDSHGVSQAQIDVMIAMQKPFDYFDDFFTRPGTNITGFTEQARTPNRRFVDTFPSLLAGNLGILHKMEQVGIPPYIPGLIADKIVEAVTDPSPQGIAEAYRRARPDLTLPDTVSQIV